jgi:predicted nucleic acid-binding protein
MIYVDTSIVLAELLAEDRHPEPAFWDETLVSSRLLEYEVWTRLHGRGLGGTHGDAARRVIARLALIELVSPVLVRALEPFPQPVRTLDALHLASAQFLRDRDPALRIATYDARLAVSAEALGIPRYLADALDR